MPSQDLHPRTEIAKDWTQEEGMLAKVQKGNGPLLKVRQQMKTSMHSQALMETAFGIFASSLRVLQSGVSTNWWGLACPSHCGSPSFGLVVAAYLAGFLSALASLCGLAFWIFGFPLSHQPVVSQVFPASRLARYLDEPTRPRFRGRWTYHPAVWTCNHCAWLPCTCCWFCSWNLWSTISCSSSSRLLLCCLCSACFASCLLGFILHWNSLLHCFWFPFLPCSLDWACLFATIWFQTWRWRTCQACLVGWLLGKGGHWFEDWNSKQECGDWAPKQVLVCPVLSRAQLPSGLHYIPSVLCGGVSGGRIYNSLPRLPFRDGE